LGKCIAGRVPEARLRLFSVSVLVSVSEAAGSARRLWLDRHVLGHAHPRVAPRGAAYPGL